MRIEAKAFGRKRLKDIRSECGSLRMRADDKLDAEFLAVLSRVIQYPELMAILLELGTAVIDKKLTAKERKQLTEIVTRVTLAARKAGE